MIGKKINQLATELAPVSTDLTIIGDPISGVSKKITLAQLGAIFSGAVSFYNDFASFPATGDINVIYCAKDTKKLYLWSGSAYVEVFPSQALLDTYQLRSEKGVSNGYASLDANGKVPIGQLPSSIMEYKGTWSAATNTPTLANGTGDTGDVYICNVAGTVNFGAGPITFAVGDYVIYSGTIWQRSSGAVGTVTSVALTVGGDAISVSGSPLTTSGTLALAFSGTSAQYINGAGNLTTFPTSLISGSGASGQVTFFNGANSVTGTNNFFWDSTNNRLGIGTTTPQRSIEIYNTTADNHLRLSGNAPSVSMGEAVTGSIYQAKFGLVTTNGQFVSAGVAGDFVIISQTGATIIGTSSTEKMRVNTSGNVSINNTNNTYKLDVTGTGRYTGQLRLESTITDGTNTYTLPSATGTLALTSQIPSVTGYVPYTGATANLDLGTHTLIAAKGTFSSSGSGDTVGITHSSGSGISLNITKGGSGEGLYINKTSGSGNAATIIGTLNATTLVKSGGTSSQFLKADGSVDSTSYGTGSVTSVGLSSATSGVTIGSTPITTSGTITLAIATASGSQQGLLSSTDWNTFNNKQSALTNPVTGTGTTNYLPKFTGTSTIGNSLVFDNGTNVGINRNNPTRTLDILGGTGIGTVLKLEGAAGTTTYLQLAYNGATNAQSGYIGYNSSSQMQFFTNDTLRATLDASGNLGLGVTPSAWWSGARSMQIGLGGSIAARTSSDFAAVELSANQIINTSAQRVYIGTGFASLYEQFDGAHKWLNAPSGTAGNAISFTQAMTLNASGNLSVGNTNDTYKLDVSGTGRFGGDVTVGGSGNPTLTITGSAGAYTSLFYMNAAGGGGSKIFANGGTNTLYLGTNNVEHLTIASTGAATFSSSVTANGLYANAGNSARFYRSANDYYWSINSDASNYLNFGTYLANGTAYGTNPKMILLDNGNVGIGTTSPNAKLTVVANDSSNPNVALRLSSTAYSGVSYPNTSLRFGSDYPNYPTWNLASIDSSYTGGNWGGSLLFYTNNDSAIGNLTERMRITSGGNVGIGTTSPANLLHLYGTDGNSYLRWTSDVATTGARIGYNGTEFRIDQQQNADITFRTNGSERMRITSGGDVCINSTSGSNGAIFNITKASGSITTITGGTTAAQNHIVFANPNGNVGSIQVSGSATSFNTSSDYRLKTDFKDFSGLDLVSKIKAYDYEWKSDKTRSYGVIAHELQSVINYAVTGVKDGKEMQGVDYSKIVPVLIKAIQEQQLQIDTLKNK